MGQSCVCVQSVIETKIETILNKNNPHNNGLFYYVCFFEE